MEICKICNQPFKSKVSLGHHISMCHKDISVEGYYKMFVDPEAGKCLTCGAPTKFLNMTVGFRKYCSPKCSGKNLNTRAVRANTVLKRYGVQNVFQLNEVKDKIKQTSMERYGTTSPSQNPEIKQKVTKTNLAKYGTKMAIQLPEFKNKMAETNIQRYGNVCSLNNPEIRSKAVNTNIEKFGVENPSKNSDVISKIQSVHIKKYGVPFPMQLYEIMNKASSTNLDRYGVKFPMQSEAIKEKAASTNMKRYGYKTAAQNPEIAMKISEKLSSEEVQNTMKRRYKFLDIGFDSSWELAFYIYHKDLGRSILSHPPKEFSYYYNGKRHRDIPDFVLDGQYIEIKGPQFYNKENQFVNPYDPSQNLRWKAKYQCMVSNGVDIITDCSEYINYVESTYGKNYLQQFRNKKK